MQGHLIAFQAAMTRQGALEASRGVIATSIDGLRRHLLGTTTPRD